MRADESHRELLAAHFHGEHGNRPAVIARHRNMLRDIQRERGLTHRGAAGDDDEIARLHAGRQLIEVPITGRDAGDIVR